MRTFPLPNVISTPLLVIPLALLLAASVAAAERESSVNFVDRGTLPSAGASGWRGNPLRTNTSAAAPSDAGNRLRGSSSAVDSRSTSQNIQASRGVQLRPKTPQTGIFSSWFGAEAKPQARNQQVLPKTQYQPLPPKTAAQRAMRLMPQFLSSSGKKKSQEAASMPTTARAGSAQQLATRATAEPPIDGSTMQASYTTAASAQSYRRGEMAGNTTPTLRRTLPSAQPTRTAHAPRLNPNPGPLSRVAPTAKPRLSATPALGGNSEASAASPAESLSRAHQLAETAHTEADFSHIFTLCQQIPASRATDEEAAFGRQLAAWALNRRGQLRARAGSVADARADFDLAIRVDAKCWRALHNRGVLLAQAGQFEPAFDDFHHSIEINPEFAKAYSNRAALYVLAGELEPALADYQQAVALNPDFAVAHRGAGRTCHLLGRVDEALEHLTTAIELAPKDASAIASRGDLLTDVGEYAAAANDYERALAANDKSADACRGSAWLLATCPDQSIRNPDLALRRAELALQIARKADAVTLDTLAAAQAGVGDFEAARQTIRRAIELAPPSERSVYQDRLQMYRRSTPYRIAPLEAVQQAGYEQ